MGFKVIAGLLLHTVHLLSYMVIEPSPGLSPSLPEPLLVFFIFCSKWLPHSCISLKSMSFIRKANTVLFRFNALTEMKLTAFHYMGVVCGG